MFRLASSEEQDAEAHEDASWTGQMREALKHFVDAISDSTRQLTLAAERFADESLRLIDDAARTARESAETSSAMASAAREAADEARRSADSLQGALNDAKVHLLSETRASIDAALSEVRELQTAGEHARTEMAQKSQAMLEETEKASREAQIAAGHVDEVYSEVAAMVAGAREASEETRGVAARIETAVEGVSAAVDAARLAADEARQAAETMKLGISESAAAAEASREAATRATEAAERAQASVPGSTAGPDLAGPQAQSLLERLESDYQLLTSLVQELAGRMSAIASSAAAQLDTDEGGLVAEDASPTPPQEVVSWRPAFETVEEPHPEAAASEASPEPWNPPAELEAHVVDSGPAPAVTSWRPVEPVVAPSWTGEEPVTPEEGEADVSTGSQPRGAPVVVPFWRDIEPSATEPRLDAWTAEDEEEPGAGPGSAGPVSEQAPPASTGTSQPAWPVPDAAPVAEADQSWPSEPSSAVVESDLLFGRIKVYVVPVSDFDRLLRLDNALSRLGSVQSVTLADFTDQQVTFNIDLASQISAPDLAQQLREASGFELEVESADSDAVTLRLG